ncbi:ErmE/ErmH/ErmO/ErmR family 23S rRNA (adenine(2058)-N(6))-methyltransferase [Streptomyces sp. 8N616]|uniref:ErmE/ErmH/ErmO/ErmR family 23S rRNA (adenine(2058)-N(6))-methyltransferase n=1 Tax=Streptomyces sp. 8N616 TaxID=3457414 RepID=UPI003FD1C9BD
MSSHQRTSPVARRRIALSQNFLHNAAAVRLVVRSARVRPADLVVEPGAGEGVLTRALARTARQVVAYEIDPRLAARLPHRTRAHPNVLVVQGDFVRARPPREPFAVVGSIPYSRTSDIVRWCLDAPALTSATLVTQLEYARKRTGGYGRWTRLTVETWPEYDWRFVARIARESFTPVPRTDSAVLRIQRRPTLLLPRNRLAAYRDFVAHGFTGTGGSLRATLARRHGPARTRAAFRTLAVDASAPVGYVTPAQWLALFCALGPRARNPGAAPGIR